MTVGGFNSDDGAPLGAWPNREPLRIFDETGRLYGLNQSLVRAVDAHEKQLASHSGHLAGMATAVSAVQSSLGSWKTAIIGVSAALFAAIGLVAGLVVFNGQTADSRSSSLETKIEAVEAKVDGISGSIDGVNRRTDGLATEVQRLPVALSREMTGLARDLSALTRSQQPPVIVVPQSPSSGVSPPSGTQSP